jgi:hypothetical protein
MNSEAMRSATHIAIEPTALPVCRLEMAQCIVEVVLPTMLVSAASVD